MTNELGVAFSVWRSRKESDYKEKLFKIYLTAFISVFAILPIFVILFNFLQSREVSTIVSNQSASEWLSLACGGLWLVATAMGKWRGPIIANAFLACALTDSPKTASRFFWRCIYLNGGILAVLVVIVSAASVWSFLHADMTLTIYAILIWIVACVCVSGIALFLWSASQASPWQVRLGVYVLLLIAMFLSAVSPSFIWNPVNWVGLVYPTADPNVLAIALLSLTFLACVLAMPSVLRTLNPLEVRAQSMRWGDASDLIASMDLSTADAFLQRPPTAFRAISAIGRVSNLAILAFRRSIIGVIRSPGRAANGAVAIFLGILALLGSPSLSAGGAIVSIVGSGLVFFGLTPYTDLFRQFIVFDAGPPVYGGSPVKFIAILCVMPVAVAALLTAAAALFSNAVMLPISLVDVLVAFITLFILIILKLAAALKGEMPVWMLHPTETPFGDVSVISRLLWHAEGFALSVAVGWAVLRFSAAPLVPMLLLSVFAVAFVSWRWRRRHQ